MTSALLTFLSSLFWVKIVFLMIDKIILNNFGTFFKLKDEILN